MPTFFTICIPVYNGELFIRTAIESVIKQSFKDWQLVIIDNASTDRSYSVAQEYTDPRISVFRNKSNIGIRGNLNTCLELCEGQWLGILPADDYYVSHALEVIHANLMTREKCILWAHAHFVFGKNVTPNIVPVYNYLTEFQSAGLRDLLYLKGNIFGELSSYFLRQSAFRDKNISFVDGSQSVDYRFYIRLLNAHPESTAIYWPDVLTHVMQHESSGSSINTRSGEAFTDIFEVIEQLANLPWSRRIHLFQALRILKAWMRFYKYLPSSQKISLPLRAFKRSLTKAVQPNV
jgi:glycosyltransferase involved in cell wall biosynthesis